MGCQNRLPKRVRPTALVDYVDDVQLEARTLPAHDVHRISQQSRFQLFTPAAACSARRSRLGTLVSRQSSSRSLRKNQHRWLFGLPCTFSLGSCCRRPQAQLERYIDIVLRCPVVFFVAKIFQRHQTIDERSFLLPESCFLLARREHSTRIFYCGMNTYQKVNHSVQGINKVGSSSTLQSIFTYQDSVYVSCSTSVLCVKGTRKLRGKLFSSLMMWCVNESPVQRSISLP